MNKRKTFKNCNPKVNNLTKDCEIGKCSYYSRCKSITRKKYNKLKKKIKKTPKLFNWF